MNLPHRGRRVRLVLEEEVDRYGMATEGEKEEEVQQCCRRRRQGLTRTSTLHAGLNTAAAVWELEQGG